MSVLTRNITLAGHANLGRTASGSVELKLPIHESWARPLRSCVKEVEATATVCLKIDYDKSTKTLPILRIANSAFS